MFVVCWILTRQKSYVITALFVMLGFVKKIYLDGFVEEKPL